MKYIVLQVTQKDHVMEVPIVFPDMLVHREVADSMVACVKKHLTQCTVRPISAGSVASMDMLVNCYGKSDTLAMASREREDSILITMNDYGVGHK